MKQYKARDKITQKMTRDGAIEVNESKGTKKRISKRAREAALLKTPEQQAAQDAQAAQPVPGNPTPDISPQRAAPAPCAGDGSRTGHGSRRARFRAYRRGAHPRSQQKGGKESTGRSGKPRPHFPAAIHRGRTGNAGAATLYQEIRQSR